MYKLHSKCRACGGADMAPVFDMGVQPLANGFTGPDDDQVGFAPLKVLFCKTCTLAQLSVIVDPGVLYSHYSYVTSASDTMRRHFFRLMQDIKSEGEVKYLLEIGSNDGAFLQMAKAQGISVRGIDPAKNLADYAQAVGIDTMPALFGKEAAGYLSVSGSPDVMLARHCFCHINDWQDFMDGAAALSKKDTLICIEVPYVRDLLSNVEPDTIYHEHTSYLSLAAMSALLLKTDFHIHRVIRYGIHGGCILIMLRHNGSNAERHLSADEYLGQERVTETDWNCFAEAASKKIQELKSCVIELADAGNIVCGFGASAKSTVLINACGFTNQHLRFITDNSPYKPGKLSPGSDIPIIEESLLLSEHPDYAVMFAWNYRDEILAKQKRWRDRGGKFIIPSPKGVEIV